MHHKRYLFILLLLLLLSFVFFYFCCCFEINSLWSLVVEFDTRYISSLFLLLFSIQHFSPFQFGSLSFFLSSTKKFLYFKYNIVIHCWKPKKMNEYTIAQDTDIQNNTKVGSFHSCSCGEKKANFSLHIIHCAYAWV